MKFTYWKNIIRQLRQIKLFLPLIHAQGIAGVEIGLFKLMHDGKREYAGGMKLSIEQANDIIKEAEEINKIINN